MKRQVSFLILGASLFLMPEKISCEDQTSSRPAHVRTAFQFTLSAPLHRAAPLFGPEGERCWAGEHWNPEFLHPQPAQDVEGAVFTVQHGPYKSIWINTRFDLSSGRIQYVSLITDVLVSTIDVRLTALDQATTGVEVTYVRTALSPAANDEVHAMAAGDRSSGTHWQKAIQGCLARQSTRNN